MISIDFKFSAHHNDVTLQIGDDDARTGASVDLPFEALLALREALNDAIACIEARRRARSRNA